MMEKRTKILATIGPSTQSQEMLEKMLKAGMNAMRLNFSHGDFAEHQGKVDNLRKAIEKTGIPASIMQDLGGPKIRIGDFSTESINLKEGQTFTITTDKIVGDETRVSVNYEPLPREVQKGGTILLHDGKKRLEIIDIKGNDVICKVIVGGDMKGRRGMNLPGAHLSISSITEKDKKDLEFGIANDVDFVAFSFARRAADIVELRQILETRKLNAKIIAKVEDVEGLENLDEILKLVDGIMIARGDMAIEIGAEHVPMVQKNIIKKCNKLGKIVITATHMLESMIKNPVPTRAEVSDIANAILDGTDAIMLSEESTLGEYPVEAVKVMDKVARRVESDHLHDQLARGRFSDHTFAIKSVTDASTRSAVSTADTLDAKFIVALSDSGHTARMISRYRPTRPVIVLTPNKKTYQFSTLLFGCHPVLVKEFKTFDEVLETVRHIMLTKKLANVGEKVVIASAMPFGKIAETNMVTVETL